MKLCKKIAIIYKKRQKAHDILLKCDINIDDLLKIMASIIKDKKYEV